MTPNAALNVEKGRNVPIVKNHQTSVEMGDEDLEAIRAKRMAELQSQYVSTLDLLALFDIRANLQLKSHLSKAFDC